MDQQTFASLPESVALVVDDEPLILMDTADMITAAGYHVIEAHSADAALAFLEQHSSLKLRITDIQMPGNLNGIQLAIYVGKHWPHISIIIASGAVTPLKGALPKNARFLNKPINQLLVLAAIEELSRNGGK